MFSSVLLFLNIGGGEMIFIIVVALFLFGGEKLPEIARGLGKGIRDFKEASEGVKREITNQINSYEEKREEEIVKPVVEEPKLLPATDEHAALPEHETDEHSVPNTMAYNENFAHTSNSNLHDTSHTDITNNPVVEETKTEPVKTTHE